MKKPRRNVPVKKPQTPSRTSAQAPMHPLRRQHSASASGGMTGRRGQKSTTAKGTLKPVGQRKVTATRKWSPGCDVACCSAEALGFLLGWDHAAVLDVYWRTCSDPDEGASIPDTLRAAEQVNDLMFWRGVDSRYADRAAAPASVPVDECLCLSGFGWRFEQHDRRGITASGDACIAAVPDYPDGVWPPAPRGFGIDTHGVILGVSLPEPHAIAVTPDGTWHSWGEPFNPDGWPDLVIDEAWAVIL